MNREADKPGDEVEIYVLGNWQYFEAMKWPRPDMAIRHYQHNRVAFARDKVAVEHRREAASEKNRQLRDSGARETVDPVTPSIIEQVRLLDGQGMSKEDIAGATGYVMRGIVNALRIIRGHSLLEDIHVKRLHDNLKGMEDVR